MTHEEKRTYGEKRLWGLLAEFPDGESLVRAARRAREAGYTKLEAYSPFPLHDISPALGQKRSKVPLITLAGGTIGALTGFFLQYWTQVYVYPMNVGGRPHNSWPSFIVVTFEMTILLAALATVVGMFALNRLPQPYHPLFESESFRQVTTDRFFLSVEADDPRFERQETARFLASLAPGEGGEDGAGKVEEIHA